MIEPVKIAFGAYLERFYNGLVGDTVSLSEFATRGFSKSVAWCPARMIDSAEEMLALWRRYDIDNASTKPAKTPLISVAFSKDFTPTGRDYTMQVSEPTYITFPTDTKNRAFKVRTSTGDIRVQLVIFAHDTSTAWGIAQQFCLFLDDTANNRSFNASYSFSGFNELYPVMIDTPENPATNIQTDVHNLSILAIDLTLRATVPFFTAPKAGEPNDGKGTNFTTDISGYPVVIQENYIEHITQ